MRSQNIVHSSNKKINVPKWVDMLYIIIVFISATHTSFAQQSSLIDSLKNEFSIENNKEKKIAIGNKLFYKIVHKKKEESKSHIDAMLHFSQKQDYPLGKAISYAGLGFYYRFLPDIDSSRYYYKKSVTILDDLPPTKYHTSTYDDYGVVEGTQGNFPLSINLLNKGVKAAYKLNSGRSIAYLLKRKGSMLTDMGDFEEAITALLEASRALDTLKKPIPKLKGTLLGQISSIEISRGNIKEATKLIKESIIIFEEIDNAEFIAVAYSELGNIEYGEEEYDNALTSFSKSKKAAERAGFNYILGLANNNLAKVYSKKQNLTKALLYIDEGLSITKQFGPLNVLAEGIATKGTLYHDNKEYTKAIAQYTAAIKLADSIKAKELEAQFYKNRSLSLEKNGNPKKALLDFKKHKKLNDSLFNEKSSTQIEKLKIIYDTEKKEKEIALQAKNIAQFEQKQAKARARQWVLAISLGSLLLICGILYYGIRQKIKRTKVESDALKATVHFKEKKLTTHALHLAHKNEVLLHLKKQVQELKNTENHTRKYQNIINNINLDINSDSSWEQFKSYFEDVHKDFNSNVLNTYPEVSPNDLRLMTLLKMNLSSKEIANILNISPEGVKKARYRLRKKLALSTEESLEELVIKI